MTPVSSDAEAGWELTDHCCRVCLGRIVRRSTPEGWRHRCADCGGVKLGRVETLCACGTKLHGGRNAGLRCRKNPDGPTPENPAEIVIEYVGWSNRS